MSGSRRRAVVVGAGAFGAASALALRARGWAVTLLDAGPVPRDAASSTDVSKVIRMDYGSDVFYHEMADAAGWHRWNREWPRPLYHEDGFLILPARPMRPGGFEHESWRVLRARGHEPVRVDGEELGRRYPAWRTAPYTDGYFNPRAGWAESGAVVARLVELCEAAGVEMRVGGPAAVASAAGAPAAASPAGTPLAAASPPGACTRILSSGSRVSGVEIAGGESLPADAVAVCTGAWTPKLLPWLSGFLRPIAQPVLHLRPADPAPFRGARFPPWAADISGSGWYGFPALHDGTLKLAHHGPGTPADPDARGSVGDEHVERARAFLRQALPDLADAPVVHRRVCMYCDTPDGDFLIDRDPHRAGLVVAAGGSGHGFKFAPLIGDVVADAVEGREGRWSARFRWRVAEAGRPARSEEARFGGPGAEEGRTG